MQATRAFTMLAWLSPLFATGSAASDAYPRLSDNTAASATLKVRKVLHGPVDALFAVPRTRQVVAAAGRYLWKFSEHGVPLDTLRQPENLFTSGLVFGPESYMDWVHTGSAQAKPYGPTVDGNALSQAELVAAPRRGGRIQHHPYWADADFAQALQSTPP